VLRAAAFNHVGHRFERAILGLGQATHVPPRHARVVSCAGAEKSATPFEERSERRGDFFDQRYGQPSSAHTVT
jgi:hypothetical protein